MERGRGVGLWGSRLEMDCRLRAGWGEAREDGMMGGIESGEEKRH
jgi:hypothetical protein